VAGRPFAAWLLARIAASGYRRALICVAHLGDMIRRAVGDGSAFGLSVTYADEGDALLGTAGALRRALDQLDPMFLVTYGDSWLPFDYKAPLVDLAANPGSLGTLAVYRNEDRFDASNCEVRGDRVVRYEKRRAGDPRDPRLDHIDYGAIALRREVIADLPAGVALGLDAVERRLAAGGRLRALPVADRFFEIGSEAGLADLERELCR
jgi:NDP-sugar pyrophosphorylase family protein